jgi:hypothetical protein
MTALPAQQMKEDTRILHPQFDSEPLVVLISTYDVTEFARTRISVNLVCVIKILLVANWAQYYLTAKSKFIYTYSRTTNNSKSVGFNHLYEFISALDRQVQLYLCSGKQRALSKVLVELYHVVYFTS